MKSGVDRAVFKILLTNLKIPKWVVELIMLLFKP